MNTKPLFAVLLALPVSFCQTTREVVPPSNYCQITRPITWQDGDNYLTVKQIDSHNRTFKQLCKKKT